MKRIVILAVPLFVLFSLAAHESLAVNTDYEACHHRLDSDRGKLAGVSDPTKKSQANGHLKAAYGDELANKFIDCVSELKAAEALMQ